MQKPKAPPAPVDPAVAEGKARAKGQALADEDARRQALRGTESVALSGKKRPTLEGFQSRGDANVVWSSKTDEQQTYANTRSLEGVETDNSTLYVLAKRRGSLGSGMRFSKTSETTLADPADKSSKESRNAANFDDAIRNNLKDNAALNVGSMGGSFLGGVMGDITGAKPKDVIMNPGKATKKVIRKIF